MCKFCDNYDFSVIGAKTDTPMIYFAGGSGKAKPEDTFRFCPVCAKRLEEKHFEEPMQVVSLTQDGVPRQPKQRQFCEKLADLWEARCPEWRFGQLIANTVDVDPFYMEDKDVLAMMERFFVRNKYDRE